MEDIAQDWALPAASEQTDRPRPPSATLLSDSLQSLGAASESVPAPSDGLALGVDATPGGSLAFSGSGLSGKEAGLGVQLATAGPVAMTLEERVVLMNDRIWAKVASLEKYVLALQSDLMHLKADVSLPSNHIAAAETGSDMVKEQLYDLSTRVDALEGAIQSDVQGQQELFQQLMDLKVETKADREDFKVLYQSYADLSDQLAMAVQEPSTDVQAQVKAMDEHMVALQTQVQATKNGIGSVNESVKGISEKVKQVEANTLQVEANQSNFEEAVLQELKAVNGQSQELKAALTQVRTDLQQADQMVESEELHGLIAKNVEDVGLIAKTVEDVNTEWKKEFLKLQSDIKLQSEDLEPRIARCEARDVQWEETRPLIEQAIQQLTQELSNCMVNIEQNEANLKSISGQQVQVQEASEDALEKLEDTGRTVEKLEQDLSKHRESTSSIYKETESLLQQLGELRRKLEETEVQGQETRADLRKEEERGEQLLTMVVEALPNLVQKTTALEHSTSDVQAGLDSATLHVQKLEGKLNEGLAQERSRSRADCNAAMDRWQSEARPRLDSLEAWRSTVEQHHVTVSERCAAQLLQQDQRITSHDELLHRLAERCQEIPRVLEARLDEVRAAAKEDLTATTLTALQGEMALMAKIAQLSSMTAAGGQPPPTAPQGVVHGQNWMQFHHS